MEWIDNVLRDVAELPDRNSPEDWPDAMLVTGAELRQIIVTHAPAESANAPQAGPVRLTDGWISVADAMPRTQQQVDIAYIDHHGKHQTTMGWHCPARTIEASDCDCDEDADSEYDKETDTYYLTEQWVDESQESEYHYPINNVTHWKPRAKHPDFNPQAKGD